MASTMIPGAPQNQTLHLAFGKPAPLSLLPCPAALNIISLEADCAAVAYRFIPSNNTFIDVTDGIRIADVTMNTSSRYIQCARIHITDRCAIGYKK